MNKAIVVISVIVLFYKESYSQFDTTFQKILSAGFIHQDVVPHISVRDFESDGTVFIFPNDQFYYYASSYGARKLNLPRVNDSLRIADLFNIGQQKIYGFGFTGDVRIFTNGRADKVVVFEKLKIKNGKAYLSFHTSNIDSKRFYKQKGFNQKFVKIKCEMILRKSEWIVLDVKVKNMRFKSVYDRE